MAKKTTVLIVDDNEDILHLLQYKLNKFDISCLTATLGEEGLQKISQSSPDLILLDLKLPKMSGLGFLKEFKQRFHLSAIPIVVLSSLQDEEISQEAIRLGATTCLSKTCSDEELIEVINRYAPVLNAVE